MEWRERKEGQRNAEREWVEEGRDSGEHKSKEEQEAWKLGQ